MGGRRSIGNPKGAPLCNRRAELFFDLCARRYTPAAHDSRIATCAPLLSGRAFLFSSARAGCIHFVAHDFRIPGRGVLRLGFRNGAAAQVTASLSS